MKIVDDRSSENSDDTLNRLGTSAPPDSEQLIVCSNCGETHRSPGQFCSMCGWEFTPLGQNPVVETGEQIAKKNIKLLLIVGAILVIWALPGNEDKPGAQHASSVKKSVPVQDTFYFTCSNGTKSLPYAVDILPGDTVSDLKKYGRKRCAEESESLNKIYKKVGNWTFNSQ